MYKMNSLLILLSCVWTLTIYANPLDEVLVKELEKSKLLSEKIHIFKELELKYAKDTNSSSSVDISLHDDYKAVIQVTQNIFDELEMTSETSIKEAKLLDSARSYLESVNALVFKIVDLHLMVISSEERVEIAKDIFEGYKKIYTEVNFSYELGLITMDERTEFKSLLDSSRVELEEEQLQSNQNQNKYKNILGYLPKIDKINIPDFDAKLPLDKDEVMLYILEYHPSLFEYRYNLDNLSSIAKEFSHAKYTAKERIVLRDLDVGKLKKQVIHRIDPIWNKNKRLKEKLLNLVWYSHYYAATLAHVKAEYTKGRTLFVEVLLAENDILKSRKEINQTKYDLLFTQLQLLDTMGILVPKINTPIIEVKTQKTQEIQQKIILYINFKYSSSVLPNNIKEELIKVSKYLLDNPNSRASITGHTSKTKHSKEKSNIALSYKRANIIKNELVDVYGIRKTRLLTFGKGHNEPIADNATSEGRIKNRRIEIELFD